MTRSAPVLVSTPLVKPAVASIRIEPNDPYQELARTDPLGLLETALQNYHRSVRDYTTTFIKQERIAGKLRPEQHIDVKFKHDPFSVVMHWIKNADKARRVIYVNGQDVDGQGRDLAVIEPQGAIARMLVPAIKLPINGTEANAASRRPIDQFGFENALQLILEYCYLSRDNGGLDLRYVGPGRIDNRDTYVLERTLPYDGSDGQYPDRKLVIHLDQQWLLPTACYCYADDQKQELLASYTYHNVHLNVGLTDQDFTRHANGL